MKPNFLPILFAFSLTATSAEFIISPRILLNPGTSPGPFFVTPDIAPSVRWQQVYGASDFMHTPGPQFLITEISFVGGGGGASLDAILPNILINLSTTRLLPDGLSTTFSANTGPDETAVFSGPLQFTFTMETYGIHLQLQQPFLYDPSMGNLLLDVRNFQTIPPPLPFGERLFESVRGVGDTVSSVVALDVNSPFGQAITTGLTARFTVIPVPEPATLVLLVGGSGLLFLIAWRRRRSGHARADSAPLD